MRGAPLSQRVRELVVRRSRHTASSSEVYQDVVVEAGRLASPAAGVSLDLEFSAVPLPQERRATAALSNGDALPVEAIPDALSAIGSCREHGAGLCSHSVALVDSVDLADPEVLWILLGYQDTCHRAVERLSPEEEDVLRADLLGRLQDRTGVFTFQEQWERLAGAVAPPPALERAYLEGGLLGDR